MNLEFLDQIEKHIHKKKSITNLQLEYIFIHRTMIWVIFFIYLGNMYG